MAQQKRIVYDIDFQVKDTGLKAVQKELKQISNMSTLDLSKMTGQTNTNTLKRQLNQAKKAAKDTEAALKAAYNPKLNTYNIDTFKSVIKQTYGNVDVLRSKLLQAGPAGERAFNSAMHSVTKFNTEIKQSHTLLNKLGTTLANTIKWNISSSLMNGVTQSIQQAWGFAKNLDSSLNDIRIVTGKSADEMTRFAERANAVASNLGKGTTDYTRAALIYAQQGLGDKEVAARTDVTLKAANVTGQSTEAVSEELTAVWNGYKASAEEAEIYVDRLAAVASTTASNLQELSTGMSKVAAAAASLGVGEEQLAAQISTIISATRQAPETVGTALKTVYARITDIKAGIDEDGTTLGEYSGKLAEMGINVLDAAGNLRNMGTVMEEIGEKWQNLTKEQQIYVAQTMAGQRQYSNLISLFDNFDKYEKAVQTANNAEGTLQKQQDTRMESLGTHLQKMTTATEKMWMGLTDNDGIKDTIDSLTTIIEKVDNLFQAIGGGKAVLNSVGTIAMSLLTGPIAKGLSTTISNIQLIQRQKAENQSKINSTQETAAYLRSKGKEEEAQVWDQKTEFFKKSQGTFTTEQMQAINKHWTAAESAANQHSEAQKRLSLINSKANLVGTGATDAEKRQNAQAYYENMANAFENENINLQVPEGNSEEIKNFTDQIKAAQEAIKAAQAEKEKLLGRQAANEKITGEKDAYAKDISDKQDEIAHNKELIEENKKSIQQMQEISWGQGESFNIFKNVGQDADDNLKALSSKYKQLQTDIQTMNENGVDKTSDEYRKLTDRIESFMSEAADYAQRSSQEMADGYKDAAEDERVSAEALKNAKVAAEQQAQAAIRKERIEGAMQFVSGLSMMQVSIQNLGNAWKNMWDTGDWMSFVGTVLASTPMLLASYTQVKNGLLRITKAQTLSAAIQKVLTLDIKATSKSLWENTAAKIANIKATRAKTAANVQEAASEKGLAASLGLTTAASVTAATAVLGVVAALAALKIAFYFVNEARRQEIEYNQKIIEQEKEKQQQYNKEKDIISEVEELNKKYEQGIITRIELKNQVEELQKKYGDQSVRIQKLIKDYKNLGQVIEQVKRERNQDEAISIQRERAAAQVNAQRTMEIMHKVKNVKLFGQTIPLPSGALGHITGKVSEKPTVQIHADLSGQQGAAASRLSSIMGEEGNIAKDVFGIPLNTFVMANASDYRSVKKQYDMWQQYINTASEEEKKTDFYKDIVDMADSVKSLIEQTQEAQIKQISNSAEFAVNNSKSDFSKINSTSDYLQQYNRLKAEIEYEIYKKNPVATPQEINQQINQALTKAIPEELQNMYGSKRQAIERLTSNSNLGQPAEDIKQMIEALDSDQLDAFLHMDLENVKSYETIYEVLKKTAQLDFSNIGGLTQANLNAAIDKYTKIQQILEAIQQGKKISGKTLQESLTKQQIKENFEADVRGQYSVKAGKTLAEVVNNLGTISVENYQAIYKNQLKEIEKNKSYINNKNNNKEYQYQENAQKKEEIKEQAQAKIDDKLITDTAKRKVFSFKYADSKTGIDSPQRTKDERRKNLKNFLEEQITSNQGNIKEETARELYAEVQAGNWEAVDNIIGNLKVDTEGLTKQLNESKDWQNNKIKQIENADIEENSKNIQPMIDFLLNFTDDDTITKNIAKLYQYKENAQKNETTRQEFQEVVQLVKTINSEYKNADENLKNLQEESQEILQQIHNGLFPIDKDVNETIVIQLGEQFQLTAQKSELLDDALKNNAKQAKEVAEQVQRYDAALKSIIKNYGNWLNILQNGSTAEKLAAMPQIKNSMADTLGISENVISNSFATTVENLNNMKDALEQTGDEGQKAYDKLRKAAYEDLLIHIGLDETNIAQVKNTLNKYFSEEEIEKLPVGTELDTEQVQNTLNELLKMGSFTAQQLEAMLSLSLHIDADVVIDEDGKAWLDGAPTRAASYALKDQQKSMEELRKAERDRIKSQQRMTEYLRDNRDLYHQINILLKDQERTISRITKNQSEMYGTELIDNLNAESRELSKQNKLYQQKQKMAKQYAAQKRSQLIQYGATFDQNGNISNYNQLKANSINRQNALIGQENGLKQAMNAYLLNGGNTSDEQYQEWQLQQTQISNQLQDAKQDQTKLDELLSGYESDKQIIEEITDKLTEAAQKQIEIKLQKFDMKVKIALDLSEAQKTWNDYKRNVLQHDDILNPNKVISANKDNVQRLADINSDSTALSQVNSNIQDILNGKVEFKTQGQKKAKLEEYQKQAIEIRKRILETEDAIKQTYLDQYSIIGETFEKQKSQYEFINNQLEHNKNLMKLVYGEEDYATQNLYNDKMIQNNLQSIESMNNRIKLAESNLQEAKKSGNTAVIEAAEAEWQTAIQNRNQLEEQSIQLIKDRYITAINQISHQMEMKLTNNKGFSYLDTEWDLLKKKSNLYLDDINSAFAIKDVQYNYTQALNDTKRLKSQQQLKKVMDEQLSILKEKDKLTQYDVDRAGKVLEIEKARIALEQARNNKTQMRLKRDSQGNYSYQYVADQDKIAEAEQKLNKAENDLYNFDKENYQKNLEEAYNATKEYHEKVAALQEEWGNATTERRAQIEEELKLLEKEYSDYVISLTGETEWTKQNLMDSAMQAAIGTMDEQRTAFENMSDAQKQKWLGDMVPAINSGIGEMIGKFSTNPDSFKQIVIEATQAMDNERKTYQEGLAKLQEAAGQNWNKIKQAMDPVVELQDKLIEDNDRLKEQAGEIVEVMNGTLDALDTQRTKWEKIYEQTDSAVRRVYDYIAAIDQAALKKINQDKKSKDVKNTDTQTIPTVNNLETYGNTAPGSSKGGGPLEKGPLTEQEAGPTVATMNYVRNKWKSRGVYMSDENLKQWSNFRAAFDNNFTEEQIEKLYNGISTIKTQGSSFTTQANFNFKYTKYTAKQWDNIVRNNLSTGGRPRPTGMLSLSQFKQALPTYPQYIIENIYSNYKNYIGSSVPKLQKFDTGGYTGDWDSSEGRMAILHEKELVLNKQDTANLLDTIQALRDIYTMNTIQSQITSMLESLNEQAKVQKERIETLKQQRSLQQQVSISASFPGVTNKNEIEAAFNELINKATQATLKNKR